MDKWVREKRIQGERLRAAQARFSRKRKKARGRAKRAMPKFTGRWKGRLIHHWRRSPSKFAISGEFLDALWVKQEGRCAYCECAIDDETLVLEHMTPLARGGRTSEDNICFACATCNERKRAMPFERWCEKIGWAK